MIDKVLSGGAFKDKRKVSIFLDFMENILKIVSPIIKSPGTKRSSTHTGKYKLTHSEVFSLLFSVLFSQSQRCGQFCHSSLFIDKEIYVFSSTEVSYSIKREAMHIGKKLIFVSGSRVTATGT